jgi:hypothetical protein
LNWPKIIGKNEVLSKSEGFKLWAFSKDKRLYNWSILLSYVHHISSRHLRRTSTVRKYIRYLVAYVTRPTNLHSGGHVGNQFWIKPRAGTKNWVCTHSSKEETF